LSTEYIGEKILKIG